MKDPNLVRLLGQFEFQMRRGNFRCISRLIRDRSDDLRSAGVTGSDLMKTFFYDRNGQKTQTPELSGEKVATITSWMDRGWKLPRKEVREFFTSKRHQNRPEKHTLLINLMKFHKKYPSVYTDQDISDSPQFTNRLRVVLSGAMRGVYATDQVSKYIRAASGVPCLRLYMVHNS